MRRLHIETGLLGLLSGTALWILIGTSSSLAYGAAPAGTVPAIPALKPAPLVIVVAQFHEPHMPSPVIVPSTAPPVAPPVPPPNVFAPIKLPPDSQAIRTGSPSKSTPSTPTVTQSQGAAKPSTTATNTSGTRAPAADNATIQSLQQILADMGYDPGPADGLAGSRTMNAIFTWIADIKDPDLQQDARNAAHAGQYELVIEYAYGEKERRAGAVATGDANAAIASTAAAGAEQAGAVATAAGSNAQAAKTKKVAVKAVQQSLTNMGYNPGAADGIAGNKTRQSVQNWLNSVTDQGVREQISKALDGNDYTKLAQLMDQYQTSEDSEAAASGQAATDIAEPAVPEQEIAETGTTEDSPASPGEMAATETAGAEPVANDAPSDKGYRDSVEHILTGPLDEAALAAVNAEYHAAYGAIVKFYQEKWGETGESFWSPNDRIASAKFYYEFAMSTLVDTGERLTPSQVESLANRANKYKAEWDEAVAVKAMLDAVAAVHNAATSRIRSEIEVRGQSVQFVEREYAEGITGAQSEIDHFIETGKQVQAELRSLEGRIDISAEQKANILADLESRLKYNQIQIAEAQTKLAALGAEYDGYQGKDFVDFGGLKANQTDIELQKIAEKAEAADQYFDQLKRARRIIGKDAEGLDAVSLNERVTDLANRAVDSTESYNEVAKLLNQYGTDINVTRKQGELEYAQAMADEAVLTAEKHLAYAQSVVQTAKNAEAVLALGGLGYALATGGLAATAVVGVQSQAVMATLDGASSAIDGFSKDGFVAGLKEGALQAGKYYVPVNTYLAVRDGHTDKLTLSLAIVGDAANLFSSYQTLKTVANKAYAAQAKLTQMTLSESDQAISRAAQAAQKKGSDLVRGYQNARFELDVAKRGGIGSEVAAAQDRLEAIVRAIDTSDEAKLALKAKSLSVQAEFVDDQARIIKDPVQQIYQKNMRDLGWTEAGLETEQIRNASSAGTVGLDEDLRIVEPTLNDRVSAPSLTDTLPDGSPKYLGAEDPIFLRDTKNYNMHPEKLKYSGPTDPSYVADTKVFRSRLLKNGKPQTLAVWEQDSNYAVNEAYKEVAGYEAKQARVIMTTTVNEEAFKDIRMLDSGVNSSSAGWAEQSASVTQEKMKHGIAYAKELGLGDGPATGLTGVSLEQAATEIKVSVRELMKDLVGKAHKAKPGYVVPPKIDAQIKILQKVVDGTYDPAVANARLIKETGTTLAKTMETLGGHFEAILKFQ